MEPVGSQHRGAVEETLRPEEAASTNSHDTCMPRAFNSTTSVTRGGFKSSYSKGVKFLRVFFFVFHW